MGLRSAVFPLILILAATLACGGLSETSLGTPTAATTATEAIPSVTGGPEIPSTPGPATAVVPSGSLQPAASPAARGELLTPVDQPVPEPYPSHITRSRYVKVNLDLLVKASGEPRSLAPGTEIVLNLFPDVVYTGIIDTVESQGDGGSWVGTLKGVEYSSLFMVYTAGVFMGHFASPLGIYEVSTAGGDLYRVDMLNQGALPQGG